VALVERGSDKHAARLDEQIKHETEGLIRSGHSTHANEWKDPEPAGEDQPEADSAPNTTRYGGTPDGMTPEDAERRAELAQYLGAGVYPADRDRLVAVLRDRNAPERIVDWLGGLPAGREFVNVQDVAVALGWGVEAHRF